MNFVSQDIEDYCIRHSRTPSDLAKKLAEYTKAQVPMAQMLTGPLEASFLGFLIKSLGAKRILEIGTFTGYSALAMAEVLPDDGELFTLDINEDTTELAKTYWSQSHHGAKITSILGPALRSMEKIPGEFDLIFVDADKENYPNYFEQGLKRLSGRGAMAFDNTLWSGRVLEAKTSDKDTLAIQRLNQMVVQRRDLYCSLVPIRDGILLVRRC